MLTKAKDLTGYTLNSRDGEIGKVKEFYFDDRHWVVRYLIADTGNWLESRRVLLSPYALLKVNMDEKQVSVDLTIKQIEDSPSLKTDTPVSKQFEESYYRYFGWPVYWNSSYAWGNYPIIHRDPEKRQSTNSGGKAWNPNLRSTLSVQGYTIHALNGEIGHIKDYIINDETWAIRYIVVDTRNWLPGKTVLISPKWIERVSWDDSKVFINLTCESIKEAPEYSEEALLTREYEDAMHKHYKREGYWTEE
jgi:uncharacterized protein YrrD